MSESAVLFLLIAALANVVGAWLYLLRKEWEHEWLRLWIGLGAGFMLAVSIAEMIPAANTRTDHAALWVLGGFLLIHLFEHVLTPHFHYGHESHGGLGAHVGVAATAGLVMHAVTDGVAIVAAVQVESALGLFVLAAAVWHKVPAGFTAASVVGATGGSRQSSLLAAVAIGGGSIVGGIVYAVLSADGWLGPALALSAGSLIYVAATDLLPEVNKRRSLLAPVGVIAGVGLFYLSHLLLEH
jgi:ZIP family zinc transporter/zinc and cadmium transporter